MSKIPSLIFSIAFIICISLPLTLYITNIEVKPVYIMENRTLSTRPALTSLTIDDFNTKIEEWLSDVLPFRSQLIATYMYLWELKLQAFVRSSVTGKEGHLFPQWNIAPTIGNYLGLNPIDKKNLIDIKVGFAGTQAFWNLKGAYYLLVYMPDKTTVYSEYLPAWTQWNRGRSWHDQVSEDLANTPINFYDLTPYLIEYKSIKPVYDKKFDVVHWNGNAVEFAYKLIAERLSKKNIIFTPDLSEKNFTIFKRDVDCSPYGRETVPYLHLNLPKSAKNISKDVDWIIGKTWEKADAVQQDNNDITFIFATDSYFKQTHQDDFKGFNGIISPFVNHVGTYIHCHYVAFNDFATIEKLAEKYHPNFVVEAFAERAKTRFYVPADPRIRILGDSLLKTPGYALVPGVVDKVSKLENASFVPSKSTVLLHADTGKPQLILPTVTTDKDGRAIIMARLVSPANTKAKLYFADNISGFSKHTPAETDIIKGENYIHLQIFAAPSSPITLRFDPGQVSGDYKFLPMPDIEALR